MEALKKVKDIGATSIQIYTIWKYFEPSSRGNFNWDYYDRQVELINKIGLKYVPFIIMGPKYAAPQWWLGSKEHKGLCCLEHNKYSPIESIWNPFFKIEISRVLKNFADHFIPMNVIESIQVGISGDYGEAIFPVLGNWPGDYHTHKGYWCGGEDAKQNFRDWISKKYLNVDELNKKWNSHYKTINDVTTFLPHRAPSRIAYFDMLDWYRQSMTGYAEFWLKESRNIFHDVPIYLCTGGTEEPEHGSLFSAQAKIASKYNCGIRLTNEGNKFYENFFWTSYTKSACNFYGAYMGLEPVGPMTKNGVVARIFGSAAYGNRQIFHYYNNLFDTNGNSLPSAYSVKKYSFLIKERNESKSVAFFWPGYYASLNGGMPNSVKEALTFMRKLTNVMPVNEEMILDGALSKYKLLVIPISGFTTNEVLKKIGLWVRSGGILLANGIVTDLELQNVNEYNEIFGILEDSEETFGHCTQIIQRKKEYPGFSKIKHYETSRSWRNLSSDTVILSSTIEGPGYSGTNIKKVSSAFYRRTGKGVAIFYCGPVNFEDDPEALFHDPGVFKALLLDVIKNNANTLDLTPEKDEIARAEIDGSVYALDDNKIIKIKNIEKDDYYG
ncbi:MAG: beta-galactosidase [Caldisphaera sp.]